MLRKKLEQLFQKIFRQQMLARNYKFTNRKHQFYGVFSAILGCISVFSILLAILLTYHAGGEALLQYGVVCLFSVMFAIVGEALAIVALYDRDQFHFFPVIGMILNLAVFIAGLYIVYAGVNVA